MRYCLDDGKLGKQIINFKYDTCNPNVFAYVERGGPPTSERVLLTAKVAKFGYRWNLGNGTKVRF
jgi:hypothetical protein